ncbi:VWA containing CoxE-like protein, partial [Halobium palmae]
MAPHRDPADDGDDDAGNDIGDDVTGDSAGSDAWRNVPDFRHARRHVVTELVRFTGRLRSAGATVPASGSLDAAR